MSRQEERDSLSITRLHPAGRPVPLPKVTAPASWICPMATAALQGWGGNRSPLLLALGIVPFLLNSFIFHLFSSPQIPCLRAP